MPTRVGRRTIRRVAPLGLALLLAASGVDPRDSAAAQPRTNCFEFTNWREDDIIFDDEYHVKSGGENPNVLDPGGEWYDEGQVMADGQGHEWFVEQYTFESGEHLSC